MRFTSFAVPVLVAATVSAQAVEEGIAPSSPPPSGCQINASSNFTIGTLKFGHTSKRETAQTAADGALVCTLKEGILRDGDGRTGSVVANRQFQFDGPPQAGAIYTGGFSICSNGSLAIGGTTRWWQCSSGGFYNLYDEYIGGQCEEIRIQVNLLTKPTPSVVSSSRGVASTVPVASVQSSLGTVTGAVSTVSASGIGPSASFSGSVNGSSTSRASSGTASTTPSGTRSGSSAAVSATGAVEAPPAGGAADATFASRTSMLGAFVLIVGAAWML
ncbi:hypothetical protein BKA63DRAFT_522286 [Paraphoma chrysanthemicola]|nr:hypothetical protein BKA63DRAFT_522286 [Paraphoma chrysanthemicola]